MLGRLRKTSGSLGKLLGEENKRPISWTEINSEVWWETVLYQRGQGFHFQASQGGPAFPMTLGPGWCFPLIADGSETFMI